MSKPANHSHIKYHDSKEEYLKTVSESEAGKVLQAIEELITGSNLNVAVAIDTPFSPTTLARFFLNKYSWIDETPQMRIRINEDTLNQLPLAIQLKELFGLYDSLVFLQSALVVLHENLGSLGIAITKVGHDREKEFTKKYGRKPERSDFKERL